MCLAIILERRNFSFLRSTYIQKYYVELNSIRTYRRLTVRIRTNKRKSKTTNNTKRN